MDGFSSVAVELRFWYERISTDNDLRVGLCDNQTCVGFSFVDNDGGRIDMHSWNIPSGNGVRSGSRQSYGSWKYLSGSNRATIKFELTSSHTTAIVSSDETTSIIMYTFTSVLKFNTGLWILTYRGHGNEQYKMRFFEATVKVNGSS